MRFTQKLFEISEGSVLWVNRMVIGNIVSIDTSKAEKLPGVKAVVTGKTDTPLGPDGKPGKFGIVPATIDQVLLPIDTVRYVGEEVAAVAAVDEDTAEEAIGLIDVEYEPLPFVLTAKEAMQEDAPLIHEDLSSYTCLPVINVVENSNICNHVSFVKGDVTKGFDESEHIFEDTFTTQMVNHAALEPHVAIAQVSQSSKSHFHTLSTRQGLSWCSEIYIYGMSCSY